MRISNPFVYCDSKISGNKKSNNENLQSFYKSRLENNMSFSKWSKLLNWQFQHQKLQFQQLLICGMLYSHNYEVALVDKLNINL